MWLSDWQVKRQAAWAAEGGRGYNRRQRTGRGVAQGGKDRRCCFQQGQRGRELGTDTYIGMQTDCSTHGGCPHISARAWPCAIGARASYGWLLAFRIAAIAGGARSQAAVAKPTRSLP